MKTFITKHCEYCNKEIVKSVGHVNRAFKRGSVNFFCSLQCSGAFKKALNFKTLDLKKQEKAEYDKARRKKLGDLLRKKKLAAYYKQLEENPEKVRAKQKEQRTKQKESGYRQAYLNTEKYKKYKHDYDQQFHAKKYGEFAEAYLLSKELKKEVDSKKAKLEAGLVNKSQKRKRLCQRINPKN